MRNCQADPERATATFAAAEASRVYCAFHRAIPTPYEKNLPPRVPQRAYPECPAA